MNVFPPLSSQEVLAHPFSRYKKIAVIFLILFVGIGLIVIARKRGQEIKPLDTTLFDSVEKDIGVFSDDASFFDEQEGDLEKINTVYEDQ
ncbi:MAG: hypothetical protein U1A25_03375 [Candidatus Sungbacteria bacterium]|nr:hypothetical protein [bacterium]MDZ4260685.1 hypothetical protein [Candidatus Sungbacteria bacterium]